MSTSKPAKGKRRYIIVCCVLAGIALLGLWLFCANTEEPGENFVEKDWGSLTYDMSGESTVFDIDLHEGSVLLGGRETWNEGEEIVFHVKSSKGADYEVGILPAEDMSTAPEYNSYGGFISEKLYIDDEGKDIVITVPETGEYGFGIRHHGGVYIPILWQFSSIDLEVEINRTFENPLWPPADEVAD